MGGYWREPSWSWVGGWTDERLALALLLWATGRRGRRVSLWLLRLPQFCTPRFLNESDPTPPSSFER
ncbi:MAG: hypothetical protein RLZZ399_702 [Verrucomicrobiota bacterium]|jgi:hypothetical protein